jgi:hypothetical protein
MLFPFYDCTLINYNIGYTEFEDSGSDSSSDMDEYGWEEDEDGKTTKHAKIKRPPSLDKYMDIMDKELSKTDVGKSFEKQKKKTEKVFN